MADATAAGALALIAAERVRQVEVEGWTAEQDDMADDGDLANAAACYAMAGRRRMEWVRQLWPWAAEWWKATPDDRIRELVKAGALIVAEIERLQRAATAEARP